MSGSPRAKPPFAALRNASTHSTLGHESPYAALHGNEGLEYADGFAHLRKSWRSRPEHQGLEHVPLKRVSCQSADVDDSSSARKAAMFWRMPDSSSRPNWALTAPSRNAALFIP
jgi:hypothetical protein